MARSRRLSTLAHDSHRLAEIVRVLARHGFGTHVGPHAPEFVRKHFVAPDGELLRSATPAVRLRLAATELGPTFIKLAQILSTRADLVGNEVARELGKLQDEVPADPFEQVRATLESELGSRLEELFAEVDEQPVGSASVAQVHLARLRDGTEVALKVQHADIERVIHADLDILGYLAGLVEDHNDDLRQYQPRALVAEFRRTLLRELDFGRERANLERFIANFADDPTVRFPAPVAALSTRKVLTMEALVGVSLAHLDGERAAGIDGREVGERGARIWLEMVFRDRFVHADPHPGNLLVLPGQRLGVLDCGMVVLVDDATREDFEDFVLAYLGRDVDGLADVLLRMCGSPSALDRRALRADVDDLVSLYEGVPLGSIDTGAVVASVTELVRKHRLVLPERMSLLLKVIAQLEGTSRLLDADFRVLELLQGFAPRLLAERYSPARLLRRLGHARRDFERALAALPATVAALEQRIREGEFEVQLTHHRLDRVVNRLVYGLVVASLLVGSSLLWSREAAPVVGGISIVGVVGVALGLVLGIRLLRAIHRSEGV